jgi:chromosome segregation ATPase
MENNTEKKGNKSTLWIILLLGSLGINVYQWQKHDSVVASYEVKTDSLITARVDVEKELSATYEELNKYKGINEHLDSLLIEANGKVDEQKARIEKLLAQGKLSKEQITKLNGELAELRKLRDDYIEKIDQLMVENNRLRNDSTTLATNLDATTKNLEATVATASVLKSEYFKVTSFKKRNNDKYSETAMAKKTNKIDVCFSMMENKIAKAGDKNVYLRIVEPGGKILGSGMSGSSTFKVTATNEEMQYTTTKTSSYNNEKTDMCLTFEQEERNLPAGTYNAEVYVDGVLSGATTFVLR